MNTVAESTSVSLREAWKTLQQSNPGMRIRECAQQLGVSEAEVLATTVGEYTTRLEGDWTELVKRLPELGRVMSLTRNDGCVLEHKGLFQKIDIMGSGARAMATVIGPIESRIFFGGWKFGFAVKQQTPRGLQQSIQIFDQSGTAVMKVFLQEEQGNKKGSDQVAFDKLVADFTASDQSTLITVETISEPPTKPIGDVDAQALRDRAEEELIQAWVARIKQALNEDQFVLNYQPMISLAGAEGEAYEVLLRMTAPSGHWQDGVTKISRGGARSSSRLHPAGPTGRGCSRDLGSR